MAFLQTPAGARSNYSLIGTNGIDIITVPGSQGPVTVEALAGSDQLTLQSTDGVASGFVVDMGDGDDRVFADSLPNSNEGSFLLQNSTIRGGLGNDIIFGTEGGIANARRSMVMFNSFINGNEGNDIIRTFGLITSRIDGGKGNDQIELTNDFPGTIFPFPFSPDRYDGGLAQGNFGSDTITLTLGRTNVVNTLINGNADADLISNFTRDLSGNWNNSTIRGGAGNDTINLQVGVSSSLLVLGDNDNDLILLGIGNDTAVGGSGNDTINILGGNNLIYGDNNDGVGGPNDNGTGNGNDVIIVNGLGGAVGLNSQNTVFAGNGSDNVTINTNGNNVIYGDANTLNGVGGNDVIRITGSGNNRVIAGAGADNVLITGSGSNTVFGGFGNDFIGIVNGRDVTLFGEDGNDVIFAEVNGAASISGGAGNDSIQVTGTPFSGVFSGGTGADTINIQPSLAGATYQQADGDSVAATGIAGLTALGHFQANSTLAFSAGVDVITNFQPTNILDTSLGSLGLDQTIAGGALYNANALNAQSGMVAGRSYFLTGSFTAGTSLFTVNAAGLDSLIVTQGNNNPLTGNSNSVILQGINAATLSNANFV